MHRKHGVDEEPGGDDRGGGQQEMFGESFVTHSFGSTDQNCHRGQAYHGGENHEQEDYRARRILKFCRLNTGPGIGEDDQ